jgi:hypothetical protein
MEESPISTDVPVVGPVEESFKFEDGTSSELSDFDEDVIIGDIEPDHYYEGGRVPVFKPVSTLSLICFWTFVSSRYPIPISAQIRHGIVWRLSLLTRDRLWINSEASADSSRRLTNTA